MSLVLLSDENHVFPVLESFMLSDEKKKKLMLFICDAKYLRGTFCGVGAVTWSSFIFGRHQSQAVIIQQHVSKQSNKVINV